MSNRRKKEDGIEVVTCDMCGKEAANSFEGYDKKTHVCDGCVRKMYHTWYYEERSKMEACE